MQIEIEDQAYDQAHELADKYGFSVQEIITKAVMLLEQYGRGELLRLDDQGNVFDCSGICVGRAETERMN